MYAGKGVLAVVCPGCDTACRPQGAVASNDIALRTNVLTGPGGPIGAAQGQASGATQPDLQSACMPGSGRVLPKRALRGVKTAVRTAHLQDLPG